MGARFKLAVVPLNESGTGAREHKLIAGRKLLLADDSAAVQKVVELTFADEGMEVVSVGDGQSALDKLEHLTPDVVLADAIMPGLTGYELCRSMKDDQRFAQIPVMLLISSFAPFDEAEAQRAGADDVITKPFQSIRQLVNRVDSLLSDKVTSADSANNQSTATFGEPDMTPINVEVESDEPHVTVLVEAAQMEAVAPHNEGGACAPDIEFQTADTAKLEPGAAGFQANEYDTLEIEPPVVAAPMHAHASDHQSPPEVKSEIRMNETVSINEPARPRFSDALLDLDDSEFVTSGISDDVVLDLDLEGPSSVEDRAQDLAPTLESDAVEAQPSEVAQSAGAEPEEKPAELSEEPQTDRDAHASAAEEAPTGPLAYPPGANFGQQELSPEAINAIAQRVIEKMSDKVVREIAWEVVPELSELMIKKKLDQG